MKLKPLNDQVLIRSHFTGKSKGDGGVPIHLLKTMRGKMQTGTVVAAGPGGVHFKYGAKLEVSVKEGDVVIFDEHAGDKVDEYGADLLLVQMHEIKAIVEEVKE